MNFGEFGRDHDGPPSCREATRSASALDRANGTRYDGRRPQQGLTLPLTLLDRADDWISKSHSRPRAMARTSLLRVSARIGRRSQR